MTLYKLVDNTLNSIETEYFQYNPTTKTYNKLNRTEEELQGWKPLVIEDYVYPNGYENSISTYVETDTEITRVYSVEQKPVEEIVAINTEFWNANYLLIEGLDTELYAAKTSEVGEHTRYLIGSTFDSLTSYIMLNNGAFPPLMLYRKPDFTQEITQEYLLSIMQIVTEPTQAEIFMKFIGNKVYEMPKVPTVV